MTVSSTESSLGRDTANAAVPLTPNTVASETAPANYPIDTVGTINVVGRAASPRVSVVIPALNEAANLRYVLLLLPPSIYEVVLVDGRSLDATIEVTRSLFPDATIIPQAGRGKGNALAAGFAACRGDIIVMLDGDGSANPQEIGTFVSALLDGADFAKGTRFAQGGGSADITWLRRIGNSALVGLVNLLYRKKYTDLCYGLNAFWTHCLPYMNVDSDGFEVEALINVRLAKSNLNVQEVGSYELRRLHGNSKLHTIRDGFRVLRVILRERLSGPTPVAASAREWAAAASLTDGVTPASDLSQVVPNTLA